jgi:hypothetical protein
MWLRKRGYLELHSDIVLSFRIQRNVLKCHQLMFCGLKVEKEVIITIHLAAAIDTQRTDVWVCQQLGLS